MTVRARVTVVVAMAAAACASGPSAAVPSTVSWRDVDPNAAVVDVTVFAPRTDVVGMSWVLSVDGLRFAAGVEGQVQVVDGGIGISAPLRWSHLSWKEGTRWVRLKVQGELTCTGVPRRVAFEGAQTVLSPGLPVAD